MSAAIDSLKRARQQMIEEKNGETQEIRYPWRVYEPEHPHIDWDRQIGELESLIVSLEREIYFPDPIQYQEMLMEKRAEMALYGERGDASAYFHTPFQEQMFQEGIERQLRYGYYDSDGFYEEGWDSHDGYGACGVCHYVTDEFMTQFGMDCCSNCAEEVIPFGFIVGMLLGIPVKERGRWNDEWCFVTDDDD
jgi:hypothetical protein